MRISDWSSDVCSSDLLGSGGGRARVRGADSLRDHIDVDPGATPQGGRDVLDRRGQRDLDQLLPLRAQCLGGKELAGTRSEEHTHELQSLMRLSYAVF